MSTTTTLVCALRKLPRSIRRDALIRNAERGHYHDFRSPFAAPKTLLLEDLRRAGAHELMTRAAAGEFDERPAAHDLARLQSWLAPDVFRAVLR